MPRGKKKPVEQHIADGTYRSDRHKLPDISGQITQVRPYTKLSKNAEVFFKGACQDLAEQKKLAPEDLMLITNLAMLAGMTMDLYDMIQTEGYTITGSVGNEVINPKFQAFTKAISEFNTLSQKMGIGPMARLRLALNQKELNKDERPKVELD